MFSAELARRSTGDGGKPAAAKAAAHAAPHARGRAGEENVALDRAAVSGEPPRGRRGSPSRAISRPCRTRARGVEDRKVDVGADAEDARPGAVRGVGLLQEGGVLLARASSERARPGRRPSRCRRPAGETVAVAPAGEHGEAFCSELVGDRRADESPAPITAAGRVVASRVLRGAAGVPRRPGDVSGSSVDDAGSTPICAISGHGRTVWPSRCDVDVPDPAQRVRCPAALRSLLTLFSRVGGRLWGRLSWQ